MDFPGGTGQDPTRWGGGGGRGRDGGGMWVLGGVGGRGGGGYTDAALSSPE